MAIQARSASRASSETGNVTLRASSDLMDDFISATDLTGESDLSVIQTGDGTRIFYLGNSGVMSLRQDPTSDTGWSEESLGAPANGAAMVCGATDAAGNIYAFAVGTNQAEPDLYVARRPAGGAWGAWNYVAVANSVPTSLYISQLKASQLGAGTVLCAILNPSPGQPQGQPGLWKIDWQSMTPAWTLIAPTDQQILESCNVSGRGWGILFANTNSTDPTKIDLLHAIAPFQADPTVLATGLSSTHLAVATGSSGFSVVASADNGYSSGVRCIQVLDCAAASSGFIMLDNSLTTSALAAVDAGQNQISVFVRNVDGLLNVIGSSAPGQWLAPFNLQLAYASIVPSLDSQGNGELLGWVPGKGLHRLWQSPPAAPLSAGTWSEQPVQYAPINQKIEQQSTYSNDLTFFDANGALLPSQTILLRASEVVPVDVGGQALMLGPNHDVSATTDAAGHIRLTTPARALDTSRLRVHVPGLMAAAEDVEITANTKIQQKLQVISTQDLLKVIPPQFGKDVDQVQAAVHAAMAAVTSTVGLNHLRTRPSGRNTPQTPLGSLAACPAFRFDVSNGSAKFQLLTADDAATAMTMVTTAPQYQAAGLFDFFENIIAAIAFAAESVIDFVGTYIVRPIGNAINVGLNFLIGGVKYIFNGIIAVAEEMFQVVEAVFSAVGTVFKKLYEFFGWLLSTARADIWATKLSLEQRLLSTVSQVAQLAGDGAQVSSTFFATLANTIDASFSQLEADLTGLDFNQLSSATLPSLQAEATDTINGTIEGAGSTSGWLRDKIGGPLLATNASMQFSDSIVADFTVALQAALAGISKAVTDGVNGFTSALENFANSSANFGKLVLATLVDAAKQLILVVLRSIDGLVHGLLGLINKDFVGVMATILNAPLSNFLIAGIYNLINPGPEEEVTVGRVLTLLCAFPVAVINKLMFDATPLPHLSAANDLSAAGKALIASGVLGCTVWAGFDCWADWFPIPAAVGVPSITPPMLLPALIVVPMLIQGLVPFPTPVSSPPEPAYSAKLTGWCLGFVTPIVTLIWAIATGAGGTGWKGPRGSLPGCVVLSAIGVASLGVNIWRVVVDGKSSIFDKIGFVAGPFSGIAKPLRAVQHPVAKVALLIVDVASDELVGISRIVAGAQMANLKAISPVRG